VGIVSRVTGLGLPAIGFSKESEFRVYFVGRIKAVGSRFYMIDFSSFIAASPGAGSLDVFFPPTSEIFDPELSMAEILRARGHELAVKLQLSSIRLTGYFDEAGAERRLVYSALAHDLPADEEYPAILHAGRNGGVLDRRYNVGFCVADYDAYRNLIATISGLMVDVQQEAGLLCDLVLYRADQFQQTIFTR